MIRPVFANTADYRTRQALILRGGTGRVSLPVRVGLIDHPTHGAVLIDGGCGPRLTKGPGRSLALRLYSWLLHPVIREDSSPMALLAATGRTAADVQTILVTHFHADHISYLRDFPNARFVTDGPVRGGLRHGIFPALLPDDFAQRQIDLRSFPQAALPFGLGAGYDVFGDGTVLAVPLPGHAAGHYGLCFPGDDPLLYAVDVQWLLAGILQDRAPGFPASLLADDTTAAHESIALVRAFAQAGGTVVLCHDPAPTPFDWAPPDV